MASGGPQTTALHTESGTANSNTEQGWRGYQDPVTDLLGSSAICHDLRVRDTSPDATHKEGVGKIPLQGGPQADRAETTEGTVNRLGLTADVGCDVGERLKGGGYLRLPPPEHSFTVYCDQENYGPVSGGGAEAGATGGNKIVEQEGLYLQGMRMADRKAEHTEGGKQTNRTDTAKEKYLTGEDTVVHIT